jgi:hypothetical protein
MRPGVRKNDPDHRRMALKSGDRAEGWPGPLAQPAAKNSSWRPGLAARHGKPGDPVNFIYSFNRNSIPLCQNGP